MNEITREIFEVLDAKEGVLRQELAGILKIRQMLSEPKTGRKTTVKRVSSREVRALRKEGKTQIEIAKALGISTYRVGAIVGNDGHRPFRSYTQEQKTAAAVMVAGGKTVTEVSRETGMSPELVRHLVKNGTQSAST